MIKKTVLRFLPILFVAACFVTYFEEDASAIPPFARKYKTSCQTCHVAFPKLNPFGMAYRANGYRMPGGDDMFIKNDPVALGAPAYKRIFPKSVWPNEIPYLPPVGFTIFSNLWIGEDNETTTEFDGLEEFSLLIGGTLGDSWSFFLDYRLYLWGTNGWLDRAFVTYTPQYFDDFDLLGIFNVRVGQFEPRATPFFGGHRNLITIKGTPMSAAWPVYPIRNFWGFFPNQKGIEFFGGFNGPKSKGGFEWAAGIVNGEQVSYHGSGSSPTSRDRGRFDDNDFKDFYGRLSYKIGGLGVMGGGEVEDQEVSPENWQDESVKFGIFYYRGKSNMINFAKGDNQNRFSRYGADVDWIISNFNVIGGVVVYDDDLDDEVVFDNKNSGHPDLAPFGLDSDDDFKTYIYTAEVNWVAYPWLIPAVRYEWIQPDYDYTGTSSYAEDDENPVTSGDFERFTFETVFLLRANVKLIAGAHFSIGEPPPSGSHYRDYFRLGLNVAF